MKQEKNQETMDKEHDELIEMNRQELIELQNEMEELKSENEALKNELARLEVTNKFLNQHVTEMKEAEMGFLETLKKFMKIHRYSKIIARLEDMV